MCFVMGEDEAKAHFAKLTEELGAFIFPNAPNCWVCGKNEWYISGESADMGICPTSFLLPDGNVGNRTLPIMVVCCERCGNLWQIAYLQLKTLMAQPGRDALLPVPHMDGDDE